MTAATPGRAVYEAHQAMVRKSFPGIAPIAWGELSAEAQAAWEGIARAVTEPFRRRLAQLGALAAGLDDEAGECGSPQAHARRDAARRIRAELEG